MADADRDSDLGDDSPVSARSEEESSADLQSCSSSDEGVGRDVSGSNQPTPPLQTHTPHQVLAPPLQPHQPPQLHQPQHNLTHHHPVIAHSSLNGHLMNHHQRNSLQPHERELKVRKDFESLKTSLHPHLSSLASIAQGAPLSTPNNVFALNGGGPTGGFPYAPPAFLAPAPPPPAQPTGSASSSSSEGSAAGWSFEEQYKQVRQLYEISDDPQRKEFLDDLFTFMQRRGTPINRLPIMAKSVLDLYELYNLVIARGGLVEVINKKLWQEIIKGLRLPSSITSAAFTLRTQYMKHLYDYECDKKNLSTRSELDAAIEGNKREGRRASGGQYDPQPPVPMGPLNRIPISIAQYPPHIQSIALSLGARVASLSRLHPLAPLPPQQSPPNPHDVEYQLQEYLRLVQLQKEKQRSGSECSSGSNMTAQSISPQEASLLSAIDVSNFNLWTIYNNNGIPPEQEEQREALNLSESPNSSTSSGKREPSHSSPPPAKRRITHPSSPRPPSPRAHCSRDLTPPPPQAPTINPRQQANGPCNSVNRPALKVTARGDASTGNQQLDVSVELNGVTYEGVLFPSQNGNGQNGHGPMEVETRRF